MTYKIILIDDHPLMRQGMRQILSLEDNIEVVGEASNGTEGVALALATEPDLIILDLNMKGISGLDTLRALRAKGVDSRIVVLTVSDAQSDIFALMDAGVPIKKPVSGIAMGLIKNPGEEKYAVLSDILGDEDHLGDMDFKTTGTRDGITATQMDIKCDGLSFEILEKALMQAKQAREYILGKIVETIPEPRKEMKPQVPRIETLEIPKEFIGAIIGPGGKIIQQMQEESGATITIDEVDGVGKIQVSAPNKNAINAAMSKIKSIVAVPEIGEVYEGTVRSIMPYGCFVEIMPGKDGLLHISEIDWKRLETVEEAGIKEGDKLQVKLLDIDPKTGKYKLSRRCLLEKPEGYVEPQRRPRADRGERRPRRDDNHRS